MHDKPISILVDNPSWILPYAQRLEQQLIEIGFQASLVREHKQINPGWINFILGCTQILDTECLLKNQHNLVVHESALPLGRGFAPMAWQILENRHNIPICLLEAGAEADSGNIWIRDEIKLDGKELCDEWRAKQGEKTIELCLRFVTEYPSLRPTPQTGSSSYYKRRVKKNSQLDIKKTIEEQFPLLRVVDNERYPAFFEINGTKYLLKIFKEPQTPSLAHEPTLNNR